MNFPAFDLCPQHLQVLRGVQAVLEAQERAGTLKEQVVSAKR
jgi:hypothetical protein